VGLSQERQERTDRGVREAAVMQEVHRRVRREAVLP
jgi:hypothetical protein